MPNWKRIRALRDDLDRPWDPESFVFDMAEWLKPSPEFGYTATIGEMREGSCRTACCLAGVAVLMFMPNRNNDAWFWVEPSAAQLATAALDLTSSEAVHMFHGDWFAVADSHRRDITQADAVRYLTKALKERNVMVTI